MDNGQVSPVNLHLSNSQTETETSSSPNMPASQPVHCRPHNILPITCTNLPQSRSLDYATSVETSEYTPSPIKTTATITTNNDMSQSSGHGYVNLSSTLDTTISSDLLDTSSPPAPTGHQHYCNLDDHVEQMLTPPPEPTTADDTFYHNIPLLLGTEGEWSIHFVLLYTAAWLRILSEQLYIFVEKVYLV